jgi:hypothetical protein
MVVMAGVTTALVVLAAIDVSLHTRHQGPRPTGAWVLLILVALASTTLGVLVLAEFLAGPPFGDGPPLGFDWGALVGISAAVVATIAGWKSLTKWIAGTRVAHT